MRSRSGFTLVEILVSMLVFTVAVLAIIGVYVSIAQLNEGSRTLMTAANDARAVLEAIREDSDIGGLTQVKAKWPNAVVIQRTALPGETATVCYGNCASPTLGADPLPVTVRVDWPERGRTRSVTVDTLVTQR